MRWQPNCKRRSHQALRDEERALSHRQVMLAQEFEHRFTHGLQLIASVLLLQSRTMTTPEASIQLSIEARRIDALGHVHHRLHLLNQLAKVEFKQCLIGLCDDLRGCYSKTEPATPSWSKERRLR